MTLPGDATLETVDFGNGQTAAVFKLMAGPNGYYKTMHDEVLVCRVPDGVEVDFPSLYAGVEGELEMREPRIGQQLSDWPNNLTSSTAVMAQAWGRHHVATANLGDSRASVIIYNPEQGSFRGFALTTDHGLKNSAECKRVQAYIAENPNAGVWLDKGYVWQKIEDDEGEVHAPGMGFTAGLGNRAFGDWVRTDPDVHIFNLQKAPFKLRRDEMAFLVLDTDGIHQETHINERVTQLSAAFNAATGRDVTPAALAEHFAQIALDRGTKDNMACAVSLIGQTNHVIGVYDGAGDRGHLVSCAARELFTEKLMHPPTMQRGFWDKIWTHHLKPNPAL